MLQRGQPPRLRVDEITWSKVAPAAALEAAIGVLALRDQ